MNASNLKKLKTICNICGKHGARINHISKSYGKGENFLVIENIPLISCPHCAESYLTAKTFREIDNIKRNRTNIAIERPILVAVLA